MNKMKMHSPDLTQANIDKIAALFPNCMAEARDADGVVTKSIDFDQLRQELSGSIVEGPQERYQLNWPGKREALLTANAPIAKTLRPCREESVDFDTTQNLFIEGDNLDALKLLQETYLNKVKMIYIDPPYNTGNDFIYEDDFAEDSASYFERSNQKDIQGNRLVANTESNGRMHSDWLSMIYSRLKLSRNLLREDGLVFISIDDNEGANLRKLCDEIFGEENFVDCIIWKKRYGGGAKEKHLVTLHEYILIYAKSINDLGEIFIPLSDESIQRYYKSKDTNFSIRGPYRTHPLEAGKAVDERVNLVFPIEAPDGTLINPKRQWYWSRERVRIAASNAELEFLKDKKGEWSVHSKQYLKDEHGITREAKAFSLIDNVFSQHGTNEILDIFGNAKIFSYPKPSKLIEQLLEIGTSSGGDEIVLDFFAGSSSTAHALMTLNLRDGGTRRGIMVQLPEVCDLGSDAFKAGYKTIAEICKDRIRRAGKKVKDEHAITNSNLDIGFRVLKIDSSNMKEVFYTPDAVSQDLLTDQVNNIREDRTSEDLLFQVLLDWGVDLALPISKEAIAGKTVYFVDGNALAACFDEGVNEDFVKLLAKREPLRVVFRDAGFASDSIKINVEQIFKLMSPTTEVKCI
ncbi:DNA methylase N-4 [Polynucleobacter sp. TUM22923]|uniref:site-specific DNA-methyltransferase n=1 Tax=Polynucleobacter sp. TUM22923 TaxID=3022126 RepID=UPI00257375E6|nr:site-specific DNA-methyltransferase [Polynucleobacter sp. TUM22923]BDX21151.1 DNA methylase N-4 [Polynucleobacter sp. TUM22923]